MSTMEEQRNYEKLIPEEPPAGLVTWIVKKGLLNKELLVYKMDTVFDPLTEVSERMVKVTCTSCHQHGYFSKIEKECRAGGPAFGFVHPETGEAIGSGKHCLCPFCGGEAEARHVSAMSQMDCVEAYPLTVAKVEKRLVLQGWCVRKWFERDGSSGITTWPYEAYVFEETKTVRLVGYLKCMSTIRMFNHWEQRKAFYDSWGVANLIYPWNKRILNGSTVENSKLDLFLRATKGTEFAMPVTYLRFWQKHHTAENLVMQGAGRLLGEMMEKERHASGSYSYYGYTYGKAPLLKELHWKEARPSKILGLTKDEFHRCLAGQWNAETYQFYIQRKAEGRTLNDSDLFALIRLGAWNYEKLRQEDHLDPIKVARYLDKQKAKDTRAGLDILRDTWRMGAALGYNMENPDFKAPAHLLRLHDRFMEEKAAAEAKKAAAANRKRDKQIKKRCKEIERFAWEADGLLIRPVKDLADLNREGTLQHHCVATYARAIAEGRSAIFLIRHTDTPEHPYFTLELDEKKLTVRQNRGKHNCDRTPEVEAFEKEWLKYIRQVAAKSQRKKQKKENAA